MNKLIDELINKLARKSFENAKQYFTTENYKSAIIALDNVLVDFPSFNNREEIYYLIVFHISNDIWDCTFITYKL